MSAFQVRVAEATDMLAIATGFARACGKPVEAVAEKVRWAHELQERYPPDPDAPTGAPAVIRSGRSELYPVIDSALLEAAALDEEQVQLVRDLKMHSVMVVPLTARDRTLGAPALLWPSIQVNIRGGALPPAESNGVAYLRIPLNAL